MTANENNPIKNGERRRKRSRLLRERVKEWRAQIQVLLAAAYEQMISQKVNPTAERLLVQVYPQAKAILPRLVNNDMKKLKQNNVHNDIQDAKNIGVFTTTYEGEEQDDLCERQSGGAQQNDGENQNTGIINTTFEDEEKDDDGEDNVGDQ